MTQLTDDQWAVVCSLRQQPDYRFLREELQLAEEMELNGLLSRDGDRWAPTKTAIKAYQLSLAG